MPKRKKRARTNSEVPAKGRLREMADQLWSLAVRADWAWKCAICGKGNCHAHHLVPRQHQATRYDLNNGIALCGHHHVYDRDLSPHQNAAAWMIWLSENHPELTEWVENNCRPSFTGTTNAKYYCETIMRLKEYVDDEDYRRICGVRFSVWLDSNMEK